MDVREAYVASWVNRMPTDDGRTDTDGEGWQHSRVTGLTAGMGGGLFVELVGEQWMYYTAEEVAVIPIPAIGDRVSYRGPGHNVTDIVIGEKLVYSEGATDATR